MGNANYEDPDELGDFLEEGWDKASAGDLAGAQRDAERTLALDPASPEAHNLMGYVLAALGTPVAAATHYEKALEIDPTFAEALLNLADLRLSVGEDAAGLALLDELLAISEEPEERIEATLMRVEALLHMGRSEDASDAAEELLNAEPERAETELAIGRVLFEVGAMELAEGRLRRAIARGADSGDAEYYLGIIADTRGDIEQATLHFVRARELDADAPAPPWMHSPRAFERIVQEAIRALPEPWGSRLEGALVICADLPGIELVADGLDPRAMVFADALSGEAEALKVGRLFVYQRPAELVSGSTERLRDELAAGLLRELTAAAEPPQTSSDS